MSIPSKPQFLLNVIGYDADVFSLPDKAVDGSGALSYESGWPRITGISLKAGGKAPQREYFNQVNKLLSQHIFFQQSGNIYDWNAMLNYNAGAHVLGSDGLEYVAISPSGPDVPGVGAKNPAGSRNKSQWLLLAETLTSSDGGLVVDPGTGKAAVDFEQMSPDKFDAILKQIRVLNWLNRNATIYVRKTGSDSNPGTLEAPFLTINKSLQHVCENYNMSKFIFTVDIGEGDFDEDVSLPSYSATTGSIQIKGVPKKTVVKGCVYANVATGTWNIDGISVSYNGRNTPGSSFYGAINISAQATVFIKNAKIFIPDTDASKIKYGVICNSGTLIISENNTIEGTMHAALSAYKGSIRIFKDIAVENMNCKTAFALASNLGTIESSSSANGGINPVIKGSATGKRYVVSLNAIISVKGGPEYFPGTSNGDAASGGQYA